VFFKDIARFVIDTTQEKIDISVYFKESTDESDILGIQKEISKFAEIKKVEYVSADQALADFVERHRKEPDLIESIEEIGRNPFLASLAIRAWEPEKYGTVSNFLESADFSDMIEKIDYFERQTVIEKIASLSSVASKIGIIISLALVVIAILVTFNTMRLSIYNSSEEIKIKRLVGASNLAIKGPLMVQGAIAGAIAAAICFLVFALLTWSLSYKIESLFYGLNISHIFMANFWLILFVQLFSGIGLGVLASNIAIKKYLKV